MSPADERLPIPLQRPASNLDAALAYARDGFKVFPLGPRSKRPLIRHSQGGHGCLDATTNEEPVLAWWQGEPHANIGIACGPYSDLLVIDVDGPEGRETLA